jgi:hypothetical protein
MRNCIQLRSGYGCQQVPWFCLHMVLHAIIYVTMLYITSICTLYSILGENIARMNAGSNVMPIPDVYFKYCVLI